MNATTMNSLAGKLFGVIGAAVQVSRENHSNSRPPNVTGFGRGLSRDLALAGPVVGALEHRATSLNRSC